MRFLNLVSQRKRMANNEISIQLVWCINILRNINRVFIYSE
ncbi:hypothetical protein mEp515_67 [Escherichia phage mEp515]